MPKSLKLPNSYGSVTKLSGSRRKPYIVRKSNGWEYDEATDNFKLNRVIIGYARTRTEGLQMLADYNERPYDVEKSKVTFSEVFEEWKKTKYPTISESNIKGYNASFAACECLYDRPFKDLRLADLQKVVDTCGKNYPTLKKLKILFNQLYSYAMKNDICPKDYSTFVDIAKYKDRNPNKKDRNKFTEEEISLLWKHSEDRYIQIILMLIYTGVRVSELLALKRENIFIDQHYFQVVASKTESGIRAVPIADKIYPFFKSWYADGCDYLLHMEDGSGFLYRNYYDAYWKPLMLRYGFTHRPHDTRHTTISMLTQADVKEVTIKKIVGHRGAMSLTERVYTHLDIKELLDAVNRI